MTTEERLKRELDMMGYITAYTREGAESLQKALQRIEIITSIEWRASHIPAPFVLRAKQRGERVSSSKYGRD